MRFAVLAFTALFALAAQSKDKTESRCGWYHNPSPGNAWLIDKDGEWLLSQQGGYETKGRWNPEFDLDDESSFVRTGASYGYGCVCMTASTDAKKKRFLKVTSIKVKKLAVCRADKKLKEPAID